MNRSSPAAGQGNVERLNGRTTELALKQNCFTKEFLFLRVENFATTRRSKNCIFFRGVICVPKLSADRRYWADKCWQTYEIAISLHLISQSLERKILRQEQNLFHPRNLGFYCTKQTKALSLHTNINELNTLWL